jgi:hypothetical protein
MPQLKNVGKEYSGYDPDYKRPVYAPEGATVEVSETKAAQLLTDFPGNWEAVGVKVEEATPPRPKRKKPATPENTKG